MGLTRASLTKFQYRLSLKLFIVRLYRSVTVVPQCHEMIRAQSNRILAEDPRAVDRLESK